MKEEFVELFNPKNEILLRKKLKPIRISSIKTGCSRINSEKKTTNKNNF